MSYLHADTSSLRNEFECMTFIWIFCWSLAPAEWSQINQRKSYFHTTNDSHWYYTVCSLMWGAYCPSGTTTPANGAVLWLTHQLWKPNSEIRLPTFGCHVLNAHRQTKITCQTFKLGHVHHNALYLNCSFHHTQHSWIQLCMQFMSCLKIVEIFIQQWSGLQSCHLWF